MAVYTGDSQVPRSQNRWRQVMSWFGIPFCGYSCESGGSPAQLGWGVEVKKVKRMIQDFSSISVLVFLHILMVYSDPWEKGFLFTFVRRWVGPAPRVRWMVLRSNWNPNRSTKWKVTTLTIPETNSLPLKKGIPKRKVVFQPSFFSGFCC